MHGGLVVSGCGITHLGGPDPTKYSITPRPGLVAALGEIQRHPWRRAAATSGFLSDFERSFLSHGICKYPVERPDQATPFVSLLRGVYLRTKYATCLNGSDSPPPRYLPASREEKNMIAKLGQSGNQSLEVPARKTPIFVCWHA